MSSAWRNTSNAAVGGVGVMLSKQATQALSEVVPQNECIITAHFSGNPAISVIVHYSPTEGSDTAEEHTIIFSQQYLQCQSIMFC